MFGNVKPMIQERTVYVISPEELCNLQGVLLDMLIELDRICKKHEICYALTGGTLLGAVRHGGFIPWDDDMDVQMFREDYVKFRKACTQDLNESRYFLQDHTTDPFYRWAYARLRRRGSEFVRVGQEHMKMKTGIFLDIFINDGVPDFYPLRLIHAAFCFCCRKILYAEAGRVTGANSLIRGIYRLLYFIPHSWVFQILESVATYIDRRKTKYVRVLTWPTFWGVFGFPRKLAEETETIIFEGREFPVIKERLLYLRQKYGNWEILPPPEKRHTHQVSKFKLPEET